MNVRPLALSEPYWSGEQFRWQTLVSGQDCNAFAVHHIKAHGPCHHVRLRDNPSGALQNPFRRLVIP